MVARGRQVIVEAGFEWCAGLSVPLCGLDTTRLMSGRGSQAAAVWQRAPRSEGWYQPDLIGYLRKSASSDTLDSVVAMI